MNTIIVRYDDLKATRLYVHYILEILEILFRYAQHINASNDGRHQLR